MTRLVALVPFLLLAACGGASFEGSFAGNYQGQPVTAKFAEDGKNLSGTIRWADLEGQVSATVEGDRAKGRVRGVGMECPFEATLREDTITCTYDLTATLGQKLEFTLTREGKGGGGGGGARAGIDPQLVGRWYTEIGGDQAGGNTVTTRISSTLNADGTYEYGGAQSTITLRPYPGGPGDPGMTGRAGITRGEWKAEGGVLYKRESGGQWITLGRYALSGSNDFMLYGADGSKTLWSRE